MNPYLSYFIVKTKEIGGSVVSDDTITESVQQMNTDTNFDVNLNNYHKKTANSHKIHENYAVTNFRFF